MTSLRNQGRLSTMPPLSMFEALANKELIMEEGIQGDQAKRTELETRNQIGVYYVSLIVTMLFNNMKAS